MTKPETNQNPDVPEIDDLDAKIFEKKEKTLTNSDKFSIKKFNNGVLEDAYDGIFDFSTENSKKEFDILKKVINANNWYVISDNALSKFNAEECTLEDLEKLTEITHSNLGIDFKEFPKKEVTNSFIDNHEDFKSVHKEPDPVVNTKKVEEEPKYIVSNLDITVKSKLNELNYRRNLVKKTNGISLKTIATCGGILAVGAIISPLSAITVPVATIIGGYAVAKAFFVKDPEVKNLDQQIKFLKEATQTLTHSKKDLSDQDFKSVLFGEPVEKEFARLCSRHNVKIDRTVFPKGHLYAGSDFDDLNRETIKRKMR